MQGPRVGSAICIPPLVLHTATGLGTYLDSLIPIKDRDRHSEIPTAFLAVDLGVDKNDFQGITNLWRSFRVRQGCCGLKGWSHWEFRIAVEWVRILWEIQSAIAAVFKSPINHNFAYTLYTCSSYMYSVLRWSQRVCNRSSESITLGSMQEGLKQKKEKKSKKECRSFLNEVLFELNIARLYYKPSAPLSLIQLLILLHFSTRIKWAHLLSTVLKPNKFHFLNSGCFLDHNFKDLHFNWFKKEIYKNVLDLVIDLLWKAKARFNMVKIYIFFNIIHIFNSIQYSFRLSYTFRVLIALWLLMFVTSEISLPKQDLSNV